jgi:hypothetical protein
MNGILNSEIDPEDLQASDTLDPRLASALRDHQYLIALMQTAVCATYRFNPNAPEMGDVTPNQYRGVMNEALLELEKNVVSALEKASQQIAAGLNLSDKLKKKV